MSDTKPAQPGDRVLAELAAKHAEIERALGHPGVPLDITPEARSIAAAAERVRDAAAEDRSSAVGLTPRRLATEADRG